MRMTPESTVTRTTWQGEEDSRPPRRVIPLDARGPVPIISYRLTLYCLEVAHDDHAPAVRHF